MGHRGNPSEGPGRKAQDGGGKLGAPLPNRKSLGAEKAEGEERQTGRPASSPSSRCGGPTLLRVVGRDLGGLGTESPGWGSGDSLPDGQVKPGGGQAALFGVSSDNGWLSGLQSDGLAAAEAAAAR